MSLDVRHCTLIMLHLCYTNKSHRRPIYALYLMRVVAWPPDNRSRLFAIARPQIRRATLGRHPRVSLRWQNSVGLRFLDLHVTEARFQTAINCEVGLIVRASANSSGVDTEAIKASWLRCALVEWLLPHRVVRRVDDVHDLRCDPAHHNLDPLSQSHLGR